MTSQSHARKSGGLAGPAGGADKDSPGGLEILHALHRAAAALSAADDVADLFDSVGEEVERVVPFHTLRLFLYDADMDELYPAAIRSNVTDVDLTNLNDPRLRLPVGRGVTGHIAANRTGEVVYDLERHPNAFHIPGTPRVEESFIGVPLLFRDELVGVLTLSRHGLHQFNPESLAVLEVLGVSIAAAIVHRRAIDAEKRARDRELRLQNLHTAFIANIGHELRTPMATAAGFFDLVHAEMAGDPELRSYLDGAQRALVGLRELIEDLLTFVSLEAGRQRLDLDKHRTRSLIDGARGRAGVPRHRVRASGDLDHDAVVDGDRVVDVLGELFENAIEFGPPGGTITVVVAAADDRVTFDVSDEGDGIPSEEREHIFDRFTQVDYSLTREHGGAGLGLTLARSIARWHGGDLVTLAGSPTTFRLTIPEFRTSRVMPG